MPRVLVPLAPGFEEIEAVTIVDALRRGGVEVVLAGLDGPAAVEGAHGIVVTPDGDLEAALSQSFDMLVLPGGEPGTTRLAADERVARLLQRFTEEQKPIGAICAAPRILAAQGLLHERAATSHASVEKLVRQGGARFEARRVVRDGRIVTSQGPGTALEFALEVLSMLGEAERAAALRRSMLLASPLA